MECKVLPLLIAQFAHKLAGLNSLPLIGREMEVQLPNLG